MTNSCSAVHYQILYFSSLIDLKPKNWPWKKLLKWISYKKRTLISGCDSKFQGPQESIGYKTKINHLEFFVGSLVLCQHKPFGQGLTSWNLSKCNDSKLHKLDSCVRYTDIRDLWFGTSHWRSFQVWYSKVGIIMLRVEPLEMSLWLQVWMKICKSCKWEVGKKFQEQSTRFPDWKCENVVDI